MNDPKNQGFIKIQSTELLFLENELAEIGSRALAYITDTVIKGIAILVLITLGSLVQRISNMHITQITLFICLCIFIGYHVLFESFLAGKTPGKYIAGIRVIKNDGSRLSTLDALIRNVLRIVDMFPAGYFLGMIIMFFEPYNRRIGDLVANTIVIYDRSSKRDLKQFIESRLLEAKPRTSVELGGLETLTDSERNVIKQLYTRINAMEEEEKIKTLRKFWDTFSIKIQIKGIDDPEVLLYELYKKI